MKKWEDALTELRGPGASELGADYKLTAIRQIATPFIRDKMDFIDTKLDPGNHEGRFKCQYDVLMQWAYMRVKNDRKHDPSRETPTDVNAFGKGGWQEQPTQQWESPGLYPLMNAEGRFLGYVEGKGGRGSTKGKAKEKYTKEMERARDTKGKARESATIVARPDTW